MSMNKLPVRFEEKYIPVTESGCWIWIGSVNREGYGRIHDGKIRAAHRVSYELHIGSIPDDLCVCHTCDMTSCVNPSHLFLGTRGDNNADRDNKGRASFAYGKDNSNSKLTDHVEKIRQLAESMTYVDIAKLYDVYPSTIRKLVIGKTWRQHDAES